MSPGSTICMTLPFEWHSRRLQRQMHCGADSFQVHRCRALYDRCGAHFHPSFLLRAVDTAPCGPAQICMGEAAFQSRILSHQIHHSERAYLYLSTCGWRAEGQADNIEADWETRSDMTADMLMERYLLRELAHCAYLQAMDALQTFLRQQFGGTQLRLLCPGSVPDWSVQDMRTISQMLGAKCAALGIRVLDSGMIAPLYTTAGLIYHAEDDFESCVVCLRAACETRRAMFDFARYQAFCRR